MATTSSTPFVKDEDAFGQTRQPSLPLERPALSMDDIGKVNRNGQFRGMLTGIAGGVGISYLLSTFTRRPRKVTIMTSLFASVAISYAAGYAYVREGMQKLEQRERTRIKAADDMTRLDLQAGDNSSFEAGVAGLHDFQDRTHSTRGDH